MHMHANVQDALHTLHSSVENILVICGHSVNVDADNQ